MSNHFSFQEKHFSVGDIVRVHQRIIEGEKERIQVFEGMIIAIKGRLENLMFTVRKIATGGIGVERIYPLVSPWITKIEIKKKGQVKRAKLYYLREKTKREVSSVTQTQS